MARLNNYEKYKHLIGSQINDWEILDIKVYLEKHHTYALAKHHCGAVKEIPLTKIINNCAKCDCEHRKRLKETTIKKYGHLIGNKINGWTILDIIPPDENRHNTFALCLCECGTIKEVKLSHITNERSKDCGCGRKEMLQETRTKNLVGQKFGKLLVIEMLEERNKNGRIIYRCKCDCGNEVNVLGNSLVMHQTLSCGCLVSYWNMYIGQLLKNNKIEYKSEYTVFINDTYYRYDFYLPQYNLFIEYDGQQHFEPIRFRGMKIEDVNNSFKKIQEHDKIKNRYCEENNINLLRIPYWETKNIETIINNHLQRLSTRGFTDSSVEYATV